MATIERRGFLVSLAAFLGLGGAAKAEARQAEVDKIEDAEGVYYAVVDVQTRMVSALPKGTIIVLPMGWKVRQT